MPHDGSVRLEILDVAGRRVSLLVAGSETAGRYAVVWDARTRSGAPAPPGVYFARLRLDDAVRTVKLVRVP